MTDTYFRRGFGLKGEVAEDLTADYHSQLVDRIRAEGGMLSVEGFAILVAKEFGFCYGVDRAVEYAYQTRAKFPDRQIYLVGEIIHNPHVNTKMEVMGITILRPESDGAFDYSHITEDDVVVLPAFGVRREDFEQLRKVGCLVVDTTCGSVLNVWKRVDRYAREGFTAVVHGKHYHEETKATVSQVSKYPGGKYMIVRDMAEAELLCGFLENRLESSTMRETFGYKASPGFDFSADLERIGVANQTTMLAGESLAIARRIGESLARRYGAEELDKRFRTFDTICSATQERQDAVLELIEQPLDVMVVIGGYNSSNTNHLAAICSDRLTTYHISDSSCIDPERGTISFKPVGSEEPTERAHWLAETSRLGITAGASTPNNKIGEAIERILKTRGLPSPI